MDFEKIKVKDQWREIVFMGILHVLLFLFYVSDIKHSVAFHDIVFFSSYAAAAWVINYKLLLFFYYGKKIHSIYFRRCCYPEHKYCH